VVVLDRGCRFYVNFWGEVLASAKVRKLVGGGLLARGVGSVTGSAGAKAVGTRLLAGGTVIGLGVVGFEALWSHYERRCAEFPGYREGLNDLASTGAFAWP